MKQMDDLRLIIQQGSLAGREFSLRDTPDGRGRPEVLIGRGGQCDIVLQEPLVSREHARFQPSPQGWILTDLGSTNGTLLNGQPLQPHAPHLLQPGDRVTIGSSVLVFGQMQGVGPVAAGAPSGTRRGTRPVRLIAGILLVVAILVSLVVALVIILQPDEETTSPEQIEPVLPIGTAIPIPSSLEDIATALPTQLQDLTTALPTQIQDLTTALPIPTQLEPMATSVLPSLATGLPDLPGLATATPAPAAAARNEPLIVRWGWITAYLEGRP